MLLNRIHQMHHQITPTLLSLSNNCHQTVRKINTLNLHARDLRQRQASRILVIDPQNQVLLFEYHHKGGDALSDKGSYYTIPGGGVKFSESFEMCAKRELYEETGLQIPIGRLLATREAPLLMPSGEVVVACERYYAVHVNADQKFDSSRWTMHEQNSIAGAHWCSTETLQNLPNLWPRQLPEILASVRGGEVKRYQSQQEQIGDCVVNLTY